MEKQTIAIVAAVLFSASRKHSLQQAIAAAAKLVDEVAVQTAPPQKVDA